MDCDYENEVFRKKVKGLESEPENGARCSICYKIRLEKTAKECKKLNYDYFGTTLTVSPYKNSQKINEIGAYLEKEYGINFLFSDSADLANFIYDDYFGIYRIVRRERNLHANRR